MYVNCHATVEKDIIKRKIITINFHQAPYKCGCFIALNNDQRFIPTGKARPLFLYTIITGIADGFIFAPGGSDYLRGIYCEEALGVIHHVGPPD